MHMWIEGLLYIRVHTGHRCAYIKAAFTTQALVSLFNVVFRNIYSTWYISPSDDCSFEGDLMPCLWWPRCQEGSIWAAGWETSVPQASWALILFNCYDLSTDKMQFCYLRVCFTFIQLSGCCCRWHTVHDSVFFANVKLSLAWILKC